MPVQLDSFLGLWAMSAEEFPSPKGRGGSESPDFSRPGAADPGCPNPDPGSLRGSTQGGRRRVSRRHGDAGGGRREEERRDLAALGRALSQHARWRRHPGHGCSGRGRARASGSAAGRSHPAGQEASAGRQHVAGDAAKGSRPHGGARVSQGRCSQQEGSGSSLSPGDLHGAGGAVEEGPRPRLDGHEGRGHRRRLHFGHVVIQVGEESQPDGVGGVLALEDAQVPDNFSETLAEADAPVIHGQSPSIQETYRERTQVTLSRCRAQECALISLPTLSNTLRVSLEALCCHEMFLTQIAKWVSQKTGRLRSREQHLRLSHREKTARVMKPLTPACETNKRFH